VILAGCVEDRARPGPPVLSFTLDQTTVQSNNPPTPPDTLSGRVRADDADGLDSVWVSVDSVEAGEDAGFDRSISFTFRFLIGSGKTAATQVPIRIRARDIAGFEVARDTYVVVVP
jgi:hypothetical protein